MYITDNPCVCVTHYLVYFLVCSIMSIFIVYIIMYIYHLIVYMFVKALIWVQTSYCYDFCTCSNKFKFNSISIACSCDPVGSVESDHRCDADGQCRCRPHVTGRSCDRCVERYYGLYDATGKGGTCQG